VRFYHIEDVPDDEESEREFSNPDTVDSEVARQKLREYGAVMAYRRLDISVGRGAELPDFSRFEFEKLLGEYGIEPRYGPDSADGLADGVGMIDE
jgi:predicted HTH domain antitoxin